MKPSMRVMFGTRARWLWDRRFWHMCIAVLWLGVAFFPSLARADFADLIPPASVEGLAMWTHQGITSDPNVVLIREWGIKALDVNYHSYPDVDHGTFRAGMQATVREIRPGVYRPEVDVTGFGSDMLSVPGDPRPTVAEAYVNVKYYFWFEVKEGRDRPSVRIPLKLDAQTHVSLKRHSVYDAVGAKTTLTYKEYDPSLQYYPTSQTLFNTSLWFNPTVEVPAAINLAESFDITLRSDRAGFVSMFARGSIDYANYTWTGGEFNAWIDPIIEIDPTAEILIDGQYHLATDIFTLRFSEGIVPEPSTGVLFVIGILGLFACYRLPLRR